MKHRTISKEPTPADLRERFLDHAKWFYFKAADRDETLVSAIHRIGAGQAQEKLVRRGLQIPPSEEVHAAAVAEWPADRLHKF